MRFASRPFNDFRVQYFYLRVKIKILKRLITAKISNEIIIKIKCTLEGGGGNKSFLFDIILLQIKGGVVMQAKKVQIDLIMAHKRLANGIN